MRKKEVNTIVLLIAITFMVSGCAQMRDKFIRKPKKDETAVKQYQPVRTYDVHPSLELYTKRYIFWKNWHRELLDVLPQESHKKKVVAIEQEVSNLMDMQSMLVDEKAEEMQKPIDELKQLEATIKKQKITHGNEIRIRKKLELIGKEIKRDYSYNKMKDYIRDDFREQQ